MVAEAQSTPRVRCAVVTLSDTRTPDTDVGGALLRERLTRGGHDVVDACILRDEPELLRAHLRALADRGDIDAVLTTGGTGLTARDSTFEALSGLFEKRLDGFGELFRMLSYQEIGPAAMLSRATAGTYRQMIVIALPGAPDAVRLGLEKLVLRELSHMVALAKPGAGVDGAHHHQPAHHHSHSQSQSHEGAPPASSASAASAAHATAAVLPAHEGLLLRSLAEGFVFSPEKLQKTNLFETPRMFCDVYALLPGQAQKPHLHSESDKIYVVLEGEGRFTLGGAEHTVGAQGAILAPAGVAHGVRNDGPARLAVLVFMAPNPTPSGK